jgi:putative Mn2+ efflux pump MntP
MISNARIFSINTLKKFSTKDRYRLIGSSIWRPALLVGLIALVMSFIGTQIGKRGEALLGSRAEVIGGLALIFIGVRILVEQYNA